MSHIAVNRGSSADPARTARSPPPRMAGHMERQSLWWQASCTTGTEITIFRILYARHMSVVRLRTRDQVVLACRSNEPEQPRPRRRQSINETSTLGFCQRLLCRMTSRENIRQSPQLVSQEIRELPWVIEDVLFQLQASNILRHCRKICAEQSEKLICIGRENMILRGRYCKFDI